VAECCKNQLAFFGRSSRRPKNRKIARSFLCVDKSYRKICSRRPVATNSLGFLQPLAHATRSRPPNGVKPKKKSG